MDGTFQLDPLPKHDETRGCITAWACESNSFVIWLMISCPEVCREASACGEVSRRGSVGTGGSFGFGAIAGWNGLGCTGALSF
jgi:hypothetical protein